MCLDKAVVSEEKSLGKQKPAPRVRPNSLKALMLEMQIYLKRASLI